MPHSNVISIFSTSVYPPIVISLETPAVAEVTTAYSISVVKPSIFPSCLPDIVSGTAVSSGAFRSPFTIVKDL